MAVRLPELGTLLLGMKSPRDGGPLVHLGMSSLIDAFFEPNTQQVVSLTPANPPYAFIVYHVSYGQTPMDTFSLDMVHAGDYCFSGRLTEEDISNGHDTWAVVLPNMPVMLQVSNDDLIIAHAFRVRLHYLVVTTPEDLREVDRAIAAYAAVRGGA